MMARSAHYQARRRRLGFANLQQFDHALSAPRKIVDACVDCRGLTNEERVRRRREADRPDRSPYVGIKDARSQWSRATPCPARANQLPCWMCSTSQSLILKTTPVHPACDETISSPIDVGFENLIANAEGEGWRMRKIGATWVHACSVCEIDQ
jgi:hypothetical protein